MSNIIEKIDLRPPPEDLSSELHDVIFQYNKRYNDDSEQIDLDENSPEMFDRIIIDSGRSSDIDKIKRLIKEISPIVTYFKEKYNVPRPSKLAEITGEDWRGDDSEMNTVNAPSYPSGHTAQAYYIAYTMSDSYPDLRDDFLSLAEKIAQSRVDRGVHYKSDLEAGRDLADQVYVHSKSASRDRLGELHKISVAPYIEADGVRIFSSKVDSDELIWHRDRESRSIKVISGEGWSLQLDNSIPVELTPGSEFFIKKDEWHRIARGHTNLAVKITKL